MIYNIADVLVGINPDEKTKKRAEKYLADNSSDAIIDFHIEPRPYEYYASRDRMGLSFNDFQHLNCGIEFHKKLLDFNGIMLHSSAVVVDNKAYLFSALSGTGKSTHTGKWLELFGDKAYILNDDKPAIRILDDGIYAYGTPWSGKHDISVNKKVPLQGICFLSRDTENWIKPANKVSATIKMYDGSLKKLTPEQLNKQMKLINQIVERIPVYEMGCTPTIEAAQMAYEVMSKAEIK